MPLLSHPAAEAKGEASERLGLEHRAWLEPRLLASGSPLSEYSFANLYLFRERHDYRVLDGEAPAVLGSTYDGERHALPLAPLTAARVEAMLDHADCIYPVAHEAAAAAQALGLGADWREADSDYVYDRARLSTLSGARTRRQQARQFAEMHAPTAILLTAEVAGGATSVLDGWRRDTGRPPVDTDEAPCREALDQLAELGLTGLLVQTGAGKPVSFMIASPGACGDAMLVHFAKGRRAFQGAYAWMFARFAAQASAAEINFEQDLGNPGFAQAKAAFGPKLRRRKLRLRRITR